MFQPPELDHQGMFPRYGPPDYVFLLYYYIITIPVTSINTACLSGTQLLLWGRIDYVMAVRSRQTRAVLGIRQNWEILRHARKPQNALRFRNAINIIMITVHRGILHCRCLLLVSDSV